MNCIVHLHSICAQCQGIKHVPCICATNHVAFHNCQFWVGWGLPIATMWFASALSQCGSGLQPPQLSLWQTMAMSALCNLCATSIKQPLPIDCGPKTSISNHHLDHRWPLPLLGWSLTTPVIVTTSIVQTCGCCRDASAASQTMA